MQQNSSELTRGSTPGIILKFQFSVEDDYSRSSNDENESKFVC